MSTKKSFKLSIFDKIYLIASDEDENTITRAAHLVDELLRTIATATQANNEGKIAVLAALRLAARVIAHEREEEKTQHAISHLIDIISQNSSANL